MDNSKTKRPRPVLSCWQCRSRKLKCNRQKPCEQCVRAARPNECTFPSEQDRVAATFHTTDAESTPEHDQIDQLPTKRARLITPEENHSARSKIEGGIGVIEDLQLRVRALEDRLSHHASTGNRDATFVQPLSRLSDGLKSLTGLEADGYRFRYRGQHHRATILKLVCCSSVRWPALADIESSVKSSLLYIKLFEILKLAPLSGMLPKCKSHMRRNTIHTVLNRFRISRLL